MKHAAAAVGLCSGSTIWPSLALSFFCPLRFFKVLTTEALSKKCAEWVVNASWNVGDAVVGLSLSRKESWSSLIMAALWSRCFWMFLGSASSNGLKRGRGRHRWKKMSQKRSASRTVVTSCLFSWCWSDLSRHISLVVKALSWHRDVCYWTPLVSIAYVASCVSLTSTISHSWEGSSRNFWETSAGRVFQNDIAGELASSPKCPLLGDAWWQDSAFLEVRWSHLLFSLMMSYFSLPFRQTHRQPFLPRYVGRDAPSSRADVSASYRVDAPEGSDESEA